jgi:pectate lyase/pectin methylesterase-like acyl-CoA thioesterase/lysophospholipase L1-like esterase
MLRSALLLFMLSWPLVASASAHVAPVRVILVGDSTMAGRTGYGDVLCQRFVPETTCINLARGGRSSASFRAEGRWDQVRALLRQSAPAPFGATYVLIQFGHNDQPGKPGRSTDLVTEFPANLARYAAQARELGAVPVLLTPLTRRSFKGEWLHDDLAPWSAATRRVARADNTALLDLNALSAQAVQAMGPSQADTLAQEGAFDYTHLGTRGATLFSGIVAEQLARLFPSMVAHLRGDADLTIPARQSAPADGWGGATRGGADASNDNVSTVTNAAELRAALEQGGEKSKIVRVAGIIDMQDPRAAISLPSNTTLIGVGAHAGFINAQIRVANAQQVIIRNLHFQNPCDAAPAWDPKDGANGNWNSQYDSITVSGSTQVWIDHNSFTDAPLTDDKLPIENGMRKQCHDGALDINKAADLITVSYNHFAQHEKNLLVGSGDGATGDVGHLRVTFSNNLFEHIAERAPRVRFGQVHSFNNLHVGDRKHPIYRHHYSIGVGKQAQIISHNNAFDIAGARACEDIVRHFDRAASFDDGGSLLNGQPLPRCALAGAASWRVPYAFMLRPADTVKAHVLANAGAGKALSRGAHITVDDDGKADFKTIQGALDHVAANFDKATPVTLDIRNGSYEEQLFIHDKDNLTLRGESRDGVLIHATSNESLTPGPRRALLLVQGSDLLTLDTLTIRNDTLRATAASAQAETLYFDNDNGRLLVRNASFLSEQDTLRLKGYAWFYRSLVAGNVDFIWGANRVALFEESEIRSVGDSARRTAGGWVVQARTVTAADKGFVFLNSRLTHGPGPTGEPIGPASTYLARSPGTPTTWDNVTFINCAMDQHIAPQGWARDGLHKQPLPNPADGSSWREFGSRDLQGRPLDLGLRVGGRVLSAQEVARDFANRAIILSAWDAGRGWTVSP